MSRVSTDAREVWLPVKGWPYWVSSLGRVRNAKGHFLAMSAHKSGYLNVQLWNKGAFKTFLAHRLVALTFHGDPPTPKHEVAHIDGDRHNNVATNLRWVLHKENMTDRDRHGNTAIGKRNGKLKFSDEDVLELKRLLDGGVTITEASKITGISTGTIYSYKYGRMRRDLWASE